MRVYLIRHGQTDSNVAKILDGVYPGPPLNQTGLAQADALAERLGGEPIQKVFSSDITRAVQTAAPLVERLGVEHEILSGLREIPAGDQQGSSDYTLYLEMIFRWADDLSFGRPGGETGEQFFARYDQAMNHIRTCGLDTVAAVSHAAAMRTWTHARVAGIDVHDERVAYLNNTDIITLETTDDGWRALTWGEHDLR